ncbi:hypothetical protein GCM10009533_49790 [Saccharopolyspora spinosporotrichia]|uniref:Uncharacterized protein n=1 Tax=Saccharopolyspora erythraea TaxID=1836 RepID=A0ABN1DJ91_SACER
MPEDQASESSKVDGCVASTAMQPKSNECPHDALVSNGNSYVYVAESADRVAGSRTRRGLTLQAPCAARCGVALTRAACGYAMDVQARRGR